MCSVCDKVGFEATSKKNSKCSMDLSAEQRDHHTRVSDSSATQNSTKSPSRITMNPDSIVNDEEGNVKPYS